VGILMAIRNYLVFRQPPGFEGFPFFATGTGMSKVFSSPLFTKSDHRSFLSSSLHRLFPKNGKFEAFQGMLNLVLIVLGLNLT
jgi:hypothetical protein